MKIISWHLSPSTSPYALAAAKADARAAFAVLGEQLQDVVRFVEEGNDAAADLVLLLKFGTHPQWPIAIAQHMDNGDGVHTLLFDVRARWDIGWFRRWFNSANNWRTSIFHETGHALGIPHQWPGSNSVMEPIPAQVSKLPIADIALYSDALALTSPIT